VDLVDQGQTAGHVQAFLALIKLTAVEKSAIARSDTRANARRRIRLHQVADEREEESGIDNGRQL